ncbi:MAG: proprotein convertase P-domain-containing protein [Oscillatoriophycideae cyanobacterium NC_groundwater_1537_Pr4_S-0.65um_50_18]|nr:proprotein convertase P-domain-containing protein [Oscillatoriophycideae cyanobacterium NC_groundwater_1537_Pr4_S-0.65um_50_18]
MVKGNGVESSMGEGQTLWRGGEALALQKREDCFTIKLSNFAVSPLSLLARQVAATSLRLLPFAQLAELRVEASHLETAMQTVRANPAIAFASHVYQMEKSPEAPLYLTDQITIQFAADVSADRMRQITTVLGLQILKLVPGVAKSFVFQVTSRAAANPLKLTQHLLSYPEVWLAEANVVAAMQPHPQGRSNEPSQSADIAPAPLDLESVWAITQSDRSTVVAVMDKAIDFSHPDFRSEGKIVAPFRLRQSLSHLTRLLAAKAISPRLESEAIDREATSSSTDYTRLVLGEKTRWGIAPKSSLMPIEMDGFFDDQSIEEMFEWASQQSADVILSGWRAQPDYFPLSLRQRMAIARAADQGRQGRGCVVIFAASGAEAPAPSDALTSSLNGFSLHPDVVAVGDGDRWPSEDETVAISAIGIEGRANAGGAARAGAIVAGVAALMLSVNPSLTAQQVKQILQETADKHPDPANAEAGYSKIGYASGLGYGRVNVLRAVQVAQQRVKRSLVARWLQWQNLEAIEIPDADPQGVVSLIQVEGELGSALDSVLDIEIDLTLEHGFASDLQIYLTSPNGETALLQNRSLGRLARLSKTYSLETTPSLKRLLDQPSAGQWGLRLVDKVPSDTGKLLGWTLRLGI